MEQIADSFKFRLSENLRKLFPQSDFIYTAKNKGNIVEVTWEENGELMGPCFYDSLFVETLLLVDETWVIVE